MGAQQSTVLSTLTENGPWNASHPLPFPYSHEEIPDLTRKVFFGLVGISSFSFCALLAMAIYIRYFDTKGRQVFRFFAMTYPVTTQSQMMILVCQLLLAQVLQLVGYLMSAIHLAKGAIIAPSVTCKTQGIFLFVSHLLSHFEIANIAIHSAYCISYLRPMSLHWFVALNVVTWIVCLGLGLIFPAIYNAINVVPFFSFGHIACFVSRLWRVEKVITVFAPCMFLLAVSLVLYPFISLKLAQHSGRLGHLGPSLPAVSRTEKEVLRASRRVLLFPLVTLLVTIPFLAMSITSFVAANYVRHHSWVVIIGGFSIVTAPLASCFLYLFMTSYFRRKAANGDTDLSVSDVSEYDPGAATFEYALRSSTVKTFISSPAATRMPATSGIHDGSISHNGVVTVDRVREEDDCALLRQTSR